MQVGEPVDLAKVTNPIDMPNADKDDAVIVAISQDGSVFLGSTKMAVDDISSRVRDRISNRLDKTVFIKSDARTKYGDVVRVVDRVRSSGVDDVGLLTDKTESRTRPPSL
jgi:biopolymer transport protein ExbD/biopolymer transport protein TolR